MKRVFNEFGLVDYLSYMIGGRKIPVSLNSYVFSIDDYHFIALSILMFSMLIDELLENRITVRCYIHPYNYIYI